MSHPRWWTEIRRKALQNAASKRFRAAHPDRVKKDARRRLLRRYGLTEEMYAEYLDAQENCCAFCGDPLRRDTHIDHDHETGAFRGIVHGTCNWVIAKAEAHFDGYRDASRR